MQCAGQTVSHIMQATQRGEPSSRRTSRCNDLRRGEYGRRSSGYWIVTAPLAPLRPKARAVWRPMLRKKCAAVSPSPVSTSTR